MEFFLFLFFFLLRNESNQFKLPGCNNRTLPVEGRIVIQPASLSPSFLLPLRCSTERERKKSRGSNSVSPCHPLSRRPNGGRTTFVVIIKCPAFKFRRLLLSLSLPLLLPQPRIEVVGSNEVVSSVRGFSERRGRAEARGGTG